MDEISELRVVDANNGVKVEKKDGKTYLLKYVRKDPQSSWVFKDKIDVPERK